MATKNVNLENEAAVEMTEDEKKATVRKYENDILGGLMAAAAYKTDAEEAVPIEIKRNGAVVLSFRIRPMGEDEYLKCKSVWSVTGQEMSGDSSEEESEGKKAVSVNAAVQGQQGNNNFEINVDMSPVIKIEGGNMDEEKVFEVMKNRIREMADDLGDEIAERMSKIFANMPLVQEA